MSTKKLNTFSFNNFKPFGEKMQIFTQKPITLIYGPNSVGKSSLLQARLYSEYLNNLEYGKRQDSAMLNFTVSNFVGDEFDLGGFPNFVHKKQQKTSISYINIINKEEDIEKFFPNSFKKLKEFKNEGMFKYLKDIQNTHDDLSEIVKSRLDNYQIKPKHYYYPVGNKMLINKNGVTSDDIKNRFLKYYDLPVNPQSNRTFDKWLKSDTGYMDMIYRKDQQEFDLLDKYLLFSFDLIPKEPIFENIQKIDELDNAVCKRIFSDVDFYEHCVNINSLEMSTMVMSNESSKLSLINTLKINNEIFFTARYSGAKFSPEQSISLNPENKFWKHYLNFLPFGTRIKEETKVANTIRLEVDILNEVNYDFITDKIFGDLQILIESFMYYLAIQTKSNIQYIGPLRYLPTRDEYYKMATNKQDISSHKNENSLDVANRHELMWEYLLASPKLQARLNQWLSDEKKLKTTYKIIATEHEKDDSSVEIIPEFVDIKKDIVVSIKDMGLGISQVLPVLISSMTMKDYKIFLEQPELHLHPAVQAELADEFIRSVKENNNEFMIETHSEHLLLRIMKRMRHTSEGKIDKDDVLALTPDDVCLLYVDSDGENTFISELELDEDGTLLDIWPGGFFEDGYNERFD